MGKIVAVSVMSAIVSISFNGCGFFKSTGNQALASLGNAAQKGISSLGDTAEKGISNALSSESKSSSGKNDSSKCSGNEIKTDKSVEKGECKGGKRNGVWKYYDNYGYIQKEITFQNGEAILEKEYDKNENLKHTTKYNKGKIVSQRVYVGGKLSTFTYTNIDFGRQYKVSSWISKYEDEINKAKQQAQVTAKQRAESKVKKPTMQEVKNSKNAMDTYRANLQAQVEKELQIELSKIPSVPNFDAYSDAQLIAYINSNKLEPTMELVYDKSVTNSNLRLRKEGGDMFFEKYNKANENRLGGGITTWETMGSLPYMQSCEESYNNNDKANYNCRTFATQYKKLIDKSAFKDRIYNKLPKPKKQ